MERLLTSREVASLLHVSTPTLSRWRDSGTGPAWLSLNGMPRYKLTDVTTWLDTSRRER